MKHWSDCSLNNEPSLPAETCDCGGFYDKVEAEVIWNYLKQNHVCVRLADNPEDDDWVIKNYFWKRIQELAEGING